MVHERFARELRDPFDQRSFQQFDEEEGAAIGERTTVLLAPFIEHRRSAQEYLEKTLRDGWNGCDGKTLLDAFLFASGLVSQRYVTQHADDETCPSCGSNKYMRFDDGTVTCFDCLPAGETIPVERVREIVADLEAQGLVEWTGEYRPARDGTLEKVYRATEKRVLH